jgi:hypothetical protein
MVMRPLCNGLEITTTAARALPSPVCGLVIVARQASVSIPRMFQTRAARDDHQITHQLLPILTLTVS